MSLVEQITQIRVLATQGLTQSQIAAATGVEIGDVATVLATASMAGLTGGGGAGSPVVRKFPFAYNTPSLATGAAVYTPTIGDVLLDAWMEVGLGWNGITPQADFGSFTEDHRGLFGSVLGQGIPVDTTDRTSDALDYGTNLSSLRDAAVLAYPTSGYDGLYVVSGATVAFAADPGRTGNRVLPAKFTGDPIKVVVSRNGTNLGADPGSTQGTAILYLVTATPA